MQRYIAATAVVFVVGIAIHAQRTGQSSAASGLMVRKTHHDFGAAKPGVSLTHQFRVHNHGPHRAILRPQGCGSCGGQTDDPIIIPPGDDSPISLTLTTDGNPGRLEKSFRFWTSDPATPELIFKVSCTVQSVTSGEPILATVQDRE